MSEISVDNPFSAYLILGNFVVLLFRSFTQWQKGLEF